MKYKKVLLILLISIFIELFIFNYPALRTLFLGNNNINAEYSINENKILISNINKRITSVYISFKEPISNKVSYTLSYLSENNGNITLDKKTIYSSNGHYINLDTYSNCKEIELTVFSSKPIDLDHILLNHPNFNINIFRILLVFISIFFILKIKDKSLYKLQYNENSKLNHRISLVVLCGICAFIIITSLFNKNNFSLVNPNEINSNDTLLLQTEAFIHGSASLLIEPSNELLQMENPYNYDEKKKNNVDFLYDTTFYNGKYYSYFGIAPIITLMLPFRLITGMYLSNYLFNLIFIFGIIFLLYKVYKKLINKFIKNISLFNFYLGYFAILFASNILITLRGLKYDIVVSSGIFFLLLSVNLAMSIYNNKKYKYIKLIFLRY